MRNILKKQIGLILVFAMTISLLAACGKSEKDTLSDANQESTPTPVEESTPEPTEAPPKDLNGMEITIANWWEQDPPPPPATQKEEDTLAYRDEIMAKHNFKMKVVNLGSWSEYQEIVVTSIMAGAPAADIFVMDQKFIAAPVQQNLLYPLNTLENINFTEEKWNQQILKLMTFGENTYGMSHGRMEPRLGVFWNKRLFEEAGINPDEPYDKQANGTWTWDALKDYAIKTTRDTNNDGIMDTYGIASFSKDFFRGVVFSNNAKYIGTDENGKFYNATGEENFLEALQWGRDLYDEGYHMPQPEGSNWDWFIAPFKEGKVAMQCAEVWKTNNWKDMEDDFGFVIFPKGPKGEMMTAFQDNIVVMPATLDKQKAEDIAFAYNLWTETTPGYEDEDWKADYYSRFRDARAVEETLPLFYELKHGTVSYLSLIKGIDYGDVTYDLDAGALSPIESVEKVQQQWQQYIDEANGLTK